MKTQEEIIKLYEEINSYEDYRKVFSIGYQKALEDNKDKKYTEEDIIKAIAYGQTTKQIDYHNDFINSLNKQIFCSCGNNRDIGNSIDENGIKYCLHCGYDVR